MDDAIDQKDPSSHKTTQDLDGDQIQGILKLNLKVSVLSRARVLL